MNADVRVWRDLEEVDSDLGRTVVTIGNFDGVHRGHRYVISRARDLAVERGGLPVVAVTFDPHPMTVIRPDKAPQALTSVGRRVRLLGEAGADAVLVLHFTPEMADLPAEDFATQIVFEGLNAAAVVVGENFRFGHRAAGDVDLLTKLAPTYDATVEGLSLDGGEDRAWSSTYIRERLLAGDVESAAEALTRRFAITGEVVEGHRRGRDLLGFPTANVPVHDSRTLVPADGVYAGWLRRLDTADAPLWPAAISVGTNPTFEGVARTVEAYVLDRDDLELYGVEVEVEFAAHLRGMERFDTHEELKIQMQADVERSRDLLT